MLSEFLDLELLRKGDIVVHLQRPGFFRIESDPEDGRVMMRRVATKGLKMRRETRAHYYSTECLVHLRRGLGELENRLNQLNPLI